MDILYTLRRKHIASKTQNEFDILHEGNSLCSISVKNIIAFSTRTELEDTTGRTFASHVYVADLNVPWHSYKVTSPSGTVSTLEWDASGEKLLIATDWGHISIWASREHVLNSWINIGGTTWNEEKVIATAFFHTGRKISIVAEKKESPLYSEKMSYVKFAPSVRCFGGYGAEGCLVVTGTGLVGALTLDKDNRVLPRGESLAVTRAALTVADVAHGKNGDFVVAVANSDVCKVLCYRVSVTLIDERLNINSQSLPSFFMKVFDNKDQVTKVGSLKFVTREDADSIVVCASTPEGGVVELWQLAEKPVILHRIFQPPNSTDTFKTVAWQFECKYITEFPITSMTTNKIALTTATPPPCYILIATSDSTVHCLYRDNLKSVGTRSLACAWLDDIKHQKLSLTITHMDLTWLGCALAVIDSHGQLFLFKVPPILEPGVGMTVNVASSLLDYSLVTGTDAWDVLVSLQSSFADAILDRISDNFNKQPPSAQQYYYMAHLQMKMALARLTPSGQIRAADINSLLMLYAVSTAFTSLLRPSDLTSHDKGPADSVACLLSENHTDIDKVLPRLDGKEFTMEPSTLQSLQQLIQWIADLALNILARLPEQYKSPSGECLRDPKALNTLRQLLVIVRVWGLLRPTCLPLFVRSAENLDVHSLLFKHLSKLVQSHEPDENLLVSIVAPLGLFRRMLFATEPSPDTSDEPHHTGYRNSHSSASLSQLPHTATAGKGVMGLEGAQKLKFCWGNILLFEYGVEPDNLIYEPETIQLEGCLATDQSLDTIRHVYLGKDPLVVKQCCRCSGKAQVQMAPRTAAIRAWDQRWTRSCRCGGSWRIHRYF